MTMRLFREQLVRYRHYVRTALRHMTWRRFCNALRVEWRLLRRNPDMRGVYPYILTADISNACNLHCPLCARGRGQIAPRKNHMSLENYVSLVEPLKDHLLLVFLYNWGEPLLNPDIYDIIQWTSRANIATFVSSNLNSPLNAERLVQSGLDHLAISADGITQEVYQRYRVGGRLDLVLYNLKQLVAARRRLGLRRPYLEWQCLVNRYNEHQLGLIRRTALALGADEVRFTSMNFYSADDPCSAQQEWLPRNQAYRRFAHRQRKRRRRAVRPCFWLWRAMVVNPDGGVVPCCLFDTSEWGNALESDPVEVWNNELYRAARERFSNNGKHHQADAPSRPLICDHCNADFLQ